MLTRVTCAGQSIRVQLSAVPPTSTILVAAVRGKVAAKRSIRGRRKIGSTASSSRWTFNASRARQAESAPAPCPITLAGRIARLRAALGGADGDAVRGELVEPPLVLGLLGGMVDPAERELFEQLPEQLGVHQSPSCPPRSASRPVFP